MARLPVPGSDDGQWGDILNSFLLVGHTADGSLKADTSTQRVEISVGGTVAGARKRINLVAGSNVTITPTDDTVNNKIDVAIAAPSAVGPQGPPGLLWRGAYDGATTYGVNDAVYYLGSSYICTLGTTGVPPTDGAYWGLLALGTTSALSPIATGDETFPRIIATSAGATLASGSVVLSYFTATKTEAITRLTSTTNTGASGTTLARYGVYSVAANGDLTLVAASASRSDLWGTSFVPITLGTTTATLSTTFNKVAGQRYAIAWLWVGTTTAPRIISAVGMAGDGYSLSISPRVSGVLTSQTDLPASIAAASVANFGFVLYGLMLP